VIRPENAIRLMTFNIHGCVGRNRREDPEAVLAVIREADADIVALQEVHDDDSADRKLLRGLETLDYSSIHYGETLRKDFGPYGNVLTSRFPVSSIERMDISVPGAEPRGAIRAHVKTKAGPWRVTATHLGLTRTERRMQIRQLLAEPCDDALDVILGDLNEWNPRSRNLQLLRAT
jgi:endonuclease/exonuclease/phosphatase family metal-dependent hydrolase